MAFLDGREEAIYDFIKKYYQNFFSKNGFEILKREIEKESVSVVYSDSKIHLKITNDNKVFMIVFGSVRDTACWSLDLIKAWFKITDYKINEEDTVSRKKVLLDSFHVDDYSGNSAFFIANFNKIKNIFASENHIKTNAQLEKLSLEKQNYLK